MMSVSAEGSERLAEIFREMLTLSKTSQSNHSQSAVSDDSTELFDPHGASGTSKTCARQGKQPSDERNEAED